MCYIEVHTDNPERLLLSIRHLTERQVIVLQTAMDNMLREVQSWPPAEKTLFLSDIEQIHSELKKL
jgi:hypothetical protein